MDPKNSLDFTAAKSDFELLDLIRTRYQVFATDIRSLRGLLLGYSLSKKDYLSNVVEFGKCFAELKNISPYARSWDSLIEEEAKNREYEIPIFFNYFDEYRKIKHDVLGAVDLTWDQRKFDFHRRIEKVNIDSPELPIKAPYRLLAVKIPNVKVHAFYLDENGKKYYEQALKDFEYLKQWAKECFDIDEDQWKS